MTLRSIREVCKDSRFPWTEAQLRWRVRNTAEEGFGRCVIREEGRVYIDLDQLLAYLESCRLAPLENYEEVAA